MKTILLKLAVYIAVPIAFFPIRGHLWLLGTIAVFSNLVLAAGFIQKEFSLKQVFNPYMLLMLVGLMWAVVSRFWVEDTGLWQSAVIILFISTSFCAVLSLIFEEDRRSLFILLLGMILIYQALGWQAVIKEGLHLKIIDVAMGEDRLINPTRYLNNINDFALMMFFSFVWFLNIPLNRQKNRSQNNLIKTLKILLIVSSLALIFFAGSRGIIIAAFVSFTVWVFLMIVTKERRIDFLILILVAATLVFLFFMNDIRAYLSNEGSVVIRFNIWKNALIYLRDSRFLGVGAGNINYYMAHFPYYYTSELTDVHSWFLGILTANGLLYGLGYLIYYFWVLIQAYRKSLSEKNQTMVFLAVWLTGFLIAGLIPDSLFPFHWFWLIQHLVFLEFEKVRQKNPL